MRFFFKSSCPHMHEIRNHLGIILKHEKCLGDKGHAGMHVDRWGNMWMTMDAQRAFIEDKAREL